MTLKGGIRVLKQPSIGNLAKRVGMDPKTIRYYEDIGLLCLSRSPNGYRIFTLEDENKLLFIKRAKMLGLSLKEISTILNDVQSGRCDNVTSNTKDLINQKLVQIDLQLQELTRLRNFLEERLASIEANSYPKSPDQGCSCLSDNC